MIRTTPWIPEADMRETAKTAFEWVRLVTMLAFVPLGVWMLTAALVMRDAAVAIEARTKEFMEVKLPEFEGRLDDLEDMADRLETEIQATGKNVNALAQEMRQAKEQIMTNWFFGLLFKRDQSQRGQSQGEKR